MTTQQYLDSVNTRYRSGISREHSYRGDLQALLETLAPGVLVTNEPARIACGAPDYILTKKGIPIGYIEAKDVGADLDNKTYKEQFARYKASLPNLIITDYLQFRLYIDGQHVSTINIGEIQKGKVVPIPEHFGQFEDLIKDFSTHIGQTITSASKLAKMMAAKAKLLANVIDKALGEDTKEDGPSLFEEANSTLRDQLNAFKDVLIHDITPKEFADIYAQTIAYGMFAARLYDPTLDDFSRQEAAELIPKSNPFLRKLFQYIAGYDLDDRIKWIVDALADVFRATNVAAILNSFGKATQQNDPIIHFYETFLAEYDPKLRKSRGVWYTPEPVVNFIVRAVDDILKTEFGLVDGLADTSKIKVKVDTQNADNRTTSGYKQTEQEVHKVQILDPAAGTGTFLAEVIKQIYKRFEGQEGIWSQYVEDHLIPRLNGFEILMASYAMAHLKLELLLRETGYKPKMEQRFRVYLTNSVEEYHPDTGTLFATWLSTEANEANNVKRDTPVMIVLGNPPYSGESQNKGGWIMNLMEDYKKEPGGKEKLKERNPKWINDDYVKFLRYGQYIIEKNGEGILAFINPHGFLDNPTFRGMRWHMVKTFNKIYTLDLHGNTKKKEVSPDGSKDENVFDIQQGVSINLFIKTGKDKTNELAEVYHADLYGARENKYKFLFDNNFGSVQYKALSNRPNMYYMVDKDITHEKDYKTGFSINDMFNLNGVGITTAHDDFVINYQSDKLLAFFREFQNTERNKEILHEKFNVREKKGWNILLGYDNLKQEIDLTKFIHEILYRPFDTRYIFYEHKLVWRTVRRIMQHLSHENIGLIVSPINRQASLGYFFVTNTLTDFHILDNARDTTSICPLYVYDESINIERGTKKIIRIPNLNRDIVDKIAIILKQNFSNEKEQTADKFAPIDILDYIYAIVHSLTYREKYKEFLKIDFPRVPYPKDPETFWSLVALGGELRQIHLLESPVVKKFITSYPQDGNNNVGKPKYEEGKVWINDEQYFDLVPQVAWNFYIGGYQPAQKWLKDRKGRELSFEDIRHYQKIIVALTETDRIMHEIDRIDFE